MAKTGKKQNFRVDVMPGGDIIVHFLLLSLQRCKDCLSDVPHHYYSLYTINHQVVFFPPTSEAVKVDSPLRERKALLLEGLRHIRACKVWCESFHATC